MPFFYSQNYDWRDLFMLFYKILLIILTAFLKKFQKCIITVYGYVHMSQQWRGQLCRVSSPLPLCVGSGNRTQGARLVLYPGDISLCCDVLFSSLLLLLSRVASLIILHFSFGYLIFQLVFMSLWLWLLFSSSWHRMPLSIVHNSSLMVTNSLLLEVLEVFIPKE